jgi:hypothetical protein
MRKFILAAGLAALGSAALVVPASASFDSHFTVFENARFHLLSNERVFTVRGGLYEPLDHNDRVGSDHGRCRVLSEFVLRCRGVIHLNGEIGGSGDIKYRGNLRKHEFRVNVTGGSGDFNGIAGKLVYEYLNEEGSKTLDNFSLVR